MKFSIKLKRIAEKHDVKFFEFTEYHLQLKGLHTVNVYESTGTFYINGMKGKERFDRHDLIFLINLAKGDASFSFTGEKAKRRSLKKSRRKTIWQRNPVCYYCKELLSDWETATTEHKIPLDKGGSNRIDNLALSHKECNQKRGNSIGVKNV